MLSRFGVYWAAFCGLFTLGVGVRQYVLFVLVSTGEVGLLRLALASVAVLAAAWMLRNAYYMYRNTIDKSTVRLLNSSTDDVSLTKENTNA